MQVKMSKRIVITGFVALLCVLSVGCGSSSSSNPISQNDAADFVANLAGAGFNGLSESGAARGASAATLKNIQANMMKMSANRNVKPQEVNYSCTAAGTCTYSGDFNYLTTCQTGGNMEAAAVLNGTSTSNGTENLNFDITVTASDWTCDGPTINSNGVSINSSYESLEPIPFTMTISGGFTSGSQSCNLNITANANAEGSGDISGTACGYSINSTF